jgi:hypothetical protein
MAQDISYVAGRVDMLIDMVKGQNARLDAFVKAERECRAEVDKHIADIYGRLSEKKKTIGVMDTRIVNHLQEHRDCALLRPHAKIAWGTWMAAVIGLVNLGVLLILGIVYKLGVVHIGVSQ